MKIVSWNVNSVRARIENILNYIKDTNPDILFLQEIKTENINFPSEAFKKNGYNSEAMDVLLNNIEDITIENDIL